MPESHRPTTKPLAGSVFYILLALADKERYGLGIVQEIEHRTRGEMVMGPGTLYNAIKKLLKLGLIEESERQGDDPRRRYYRITPAGLARVKDEASRLALVVDAAREKNLVPSGR